MLQSEAASVSILPRLKPQPSSAATSRLDVTTPHPGPTGTFRVDRASGDWTWSDELYEIYGFAPGDVVPSSDLVARHQHPEDRPEVEALLADALETGAPFSLWHRLVTAQGVVRQVAMLSAGEFDEAGDLVGVRGFVVDLTEPLRLAASREVDDAMEQMSHSRPLIEQAKGGLMLTYGLDAPAAFELLRRYSQQVNVKVRDVASQLVAAFAAGGLPPEIAGALDRLAVHGDVMEPVPDLRTEANPGA